MNKIYIKYKKENELIKNLLKDENIERCKEKSLFQKLNFKNKAETFDIYFHSGILDKKALENIKLAKKNIVSSNFLKEKLISDYEIQEEKIELIYPSINIDKSKNLKEEKKKF